MTLAPTPLSRVTSTSDKDLVRKVIRSVNIRRLNEDLAQNFSRKHVSKPCQIVFTLIRIWIRDYKGLTMFQFTQPCPLFESGKDAGVMLL